MDFYEAYHFLDKHPIFYRQFNDGLDIMVVKVNPKNNRIDDDNTKNTKTEAQSH